MKKRKKTEKKKKSGIPAAVVAWVRGTIKDLEKIRDKLIDADYDDEDEEVLFSVEGAISELSALLPLTSAAETLKKAVRATADGESNSFTNHDWNTLAEQLGIGRSGGTHPPG